MSSRSQSLRPPASQPALSDSLIRLDEGERILSKAAADALVQRIFALAQGGGMTRVSLRNTWHGELRWARNRVSLASDRRTLSLTIARRLRGGNIGLADTNQLDPVSLEATVRAAELLSLQDGGTAQLPDYLVPPPEQPLPKVTVWSEAASSLAAEARAGVVPAVIEPAEAKGMLSAGYLSVQAHAQLAQCHGEREADYVWKNDDEWVDERYSIEPYFLFTTAECSMTVRDQTGTGSGWAGLTNFDWSAIDTKALGERALEKGLASRNPVALEPGRYTVILEPQAVTDLLDILLFTPLMLQRMVIEGGRRNAPFFQSYDPALGIYRTKLGLKVADERVTISHDPADPVLGIVPGNSRGLAPVTWIKNGVLTELGHSREYALAALRKETSTQGLAYGYRMSGGPTTMEEMIQSTKRGLLVTRFSNLGQVGDPINLLTTGLTRDGLWLIENGKITKAVKNFRFTESPMFMLNSIEQLGVPAPVFRKAAPDNPIPLPAFVPPLKVRDFSFTAVADAV